LSGINEENKNVKDATKGYIQETTERVVYSNPSKGNNNDSNYNSNYNKNNNYNEYKPPVKNEFHKPTFVNSSLENKPNNFKELEQSADVNILNNYLIL